MPRKFLKKLLPDADQFASIDGMQSVSARLGAGLNDPQLWQFNRKSVAAGVAIGLFVGWLPIPMQMLLAAFLALKLHVNLPVSVVLVWISNPLTFAGFLYAGYHVGRILTGQPSDGSPIRFSGELLLSRIHELWLPMLFGCVVLGLASAVTGYLLTRLVWRVSASRRWSLRRLRRRRIPEN